MAKKKVSLKDKILNNEALISSAKEAGRVLFSMLVAGVLLFIGQELSVLDPTGNQFLILTVVYKALDKYVHKNENISVDGVVPF